MAKQRKYAVQLLWNKSDLGREDKSGLLIEQLRYAGLVSIVQETDRAYMLRLHCPHGLISEVWATQNATRMKSFGLNAEPVPEIY